MTSSSTTHHCPLGRSGWSALPSEFPPERAEVFRTLISRLIERGSLDGGPDSWDHIVIGTNTTGDYDKRAVGATFTSTNVFQPFGSKDTFAWGEDAPSLGEMWQVKAGVLDAVFSLNEDGNRKDCMEDGPKARVDGVRIWVDNRLPAWFVMGSLDSDNTDRGALVASGLITVSGWCYPLMDEGSSSMLASLCEYVPLPEALRLVTDLGVSVSMVEECFKHDMGTIDWDTVPPLSPSERKRFVDTCSLPVDYPPAPTINPNIKMRPFPTKTPPGFYLAC